MKDTIVTAIFHYSYASRMGGRNYSFEFYENPFRNLLNLGLNIVVFSHEPEIAKIELFFERNKFSDYKIISYDLNNYEFSDKIYKLKEDNGIINSDGLVPGLHMFNNDRNTHLCLSKIDFLKITIQNDYFNSDNYYWIDAGLFHNGIIPASFGGMEKLVKPNEKTFYPLSETNLCKPGLLDRLNEKNNNKELLFVGSSAFHASPNWWNKLGLQVKNVHIIGGVFGGNKEEVLDLCSKFKDLTGKIFLLNELTLEEDILTAIVMENNFNYLKFDTWYHDIKTDSCYYNIPESANSFYKIFL